VGGGRTPGAWRPEAALRHADTITHVTVQETITVSGVRCERCIGRLAHALRTHEGIESANANLLGEVTLAWDDATTTREAIVTALARSGFPEVAVQGE
jgi:copper chaperone CopZ